MTGVQTCALPILFGVLLLNLPKKVSNFLTLVDDATRSTWVYLMKYKLDTRPLLVSFYNMICT